MKKIEWNKVTWYSKLASMFVLLGFVPALAFYIGLQYGYTVISMSTASNASTIESLKSYTSTTTDSTTTEYR